MMHSRALCAFAQDGLCKQPPDFCRQCKIEPEDSAFHKRLCVGAFSWIDIDRMQHGHERTTHVKGKATF